MINITHNMPGVAGAGRTARGEQITRASAKGSTVPTFRKLRS